MPNLLQRQNAGILDLTHCELADPAERQTRVSGNAVPLALPVVDGLTGVIDDDLGFTHGCKNIAIVMNGQRSISLLHYADSVR